MAKTVLFEPWIATASTPFRRRYSCISVPGVTSNLEHTLQNHSRIYAPSTSFLFSLKMITGGAVFCRHSRR